MTATSPWTDDRVATLKRLWSDGLSAREIALELRGVTRNAVLGKLHRLDLLGGRPKVTATKPKAPCRPRLRFAPSSSAVGAPGRETGQLRLAREPAFQLKNWHRSLGGQAT